MVRKLNLVVFYFLGQMVENLKEISKMVYKREKEYSLISLVSEEKAIGYRVREHTGYKS